METCYRPQQLLLYFVAIFSLSSSTLLFSLVLALITLKCYRRINDAGYWPRQIDLINVVACWGKKTGKLKTLQDKNMINRNKLNIGTPSPGKTCTEKITTDSKK